MAGVHEHLTGSRSHEGRIRRALAALLSRQSHDGFVIFEDRRTQKFVQFAGSSDEGLWLDLPSQALDAAESARADHHFARIGIQASESDLLTAPDGKVVGRQRSFQQRFDRDIEAATRATLEVFDRVYQLPREFEMGVIEN